MPFKPDVDIHGYSDRMDYFLSKIETEIEDKDKVAVIKRFKQDWQNKARGLNFGLPRFCKYLANLYVIFLILDKEDFADVDEIKETPLMGNTGLPWITEDHAWKIVHHLKNRPNVNENSWTVADYIFIFKPFMRWYRKRYGYPEGYPDGDFNNKMLPLLDQAPELKQVIVKYPKATKTADDIPPMWVFDALYNAAPPHPRNKAFFAMWKENPNRIGGLGSLQCKNFHQDDLGYKITMNDKTFTGEPVRFVESQIDISMYIQWLEKNSLWRPDNPFWIDLKKFPKGEVTHMRYGAFRSLINKTKNRHNIKVKKNNGLKIIDYKLTTHVARYAKTVQLRKEKKPDWFIEKQMGWVPGSDRLSYYSKFDSSDIDGVIEADLGIVKNNEPIKCPRCTRNNPADSSFCRFCKSPLNMGKLVELEETKDGLSEALEVAKNLDTKIDMFKKMEARLQAMEDELAELKGK